MPVEIGSRLLVTWRDRTGSSRLVTGKVGSWYSRDFAWGTLAGAVLNLDKPLRAYGTVLDSAANFREPGVAPESHQLLLVPRQPGGAWADSGTVQVEVRASDPAVRDEPGWWLSAYGDYEVRDIGSGWSRLVWRRVLAAGAVLFGLAALVAAIAGGGAARHLAWPGTAEWPEGAAAAIIAGALAALVLVVTVRALWVPRVRAMAAVLLGVMFLVAFFLLTLGTFIATYGDPA